MPLGSEEVVIARAALIVIDNVAVFVSLVGEVESVTVNVTDVRPVAVGVPVICPELLSERPAGSAVDVNV
jgi:hypothetical protein